MSSRQQRWMWLAITGGVLLVSLGAWRVLSASKPAPSLTLVTAQPTRTIPTPSPTPTATLTPSPKPTATLTPFPTPTATVTSPTQSFDADIAYLRVLEQCGFGARPPGSINHRLLGDYLISTVEGFGWQTEVQEFTYRDMPVRNIAARKGKGPVIILGAHYDTRPYADHDPPETQHQHILGANDGASGVAVLLELARVLDMDKVPYEVWLVLFDAEDSGNLNGWPFSVGAEEYAEKLQAAPEYVIVVDMVGDRDQAFYWDGNSDPELNEQIWSLAAELGYEQFFVPEVRWKMIDDHLPFVKRGWKAIDIIDFDYAYWHTTQDTADKVSAESLGRIGRVIEVLLEGAGD